MKVKSKKNFVVSLSAIRYPLYAILFGMLLTGCASLKEAAKGVAGISTKVLEDNRKDALTKTYNHDYNACYNKTVDILQRTGYYIYTKDIKKKLIAIYLSEEDTTPVGIFFKEIGAADTIIEVSSSSTYAKEHIAQKLFIALDRAFNPKEKENKDEKEKSKDNKQPH